MKEKVNYYKLWLSVALTILPLIVGMMIYGNTVPYTVGSITLLLMPFIGLFIVVNSIKYTKEKEDD